MHPLIRILCLLVLAASLPALGPLPLASILLLLILVLAAAVPGGIARFLQGLQRLRWLFLALLVLYVGFTPGDPVIDALPGLSAEGLQEGARRASVLAVLLAAVQWLLARTPTAQLVEGLRQLLAPLRLFRIDGNRFALRLALVLDRVGAMQSQVAGLRQGSNNLLDTAAALVLRIEDPPGDTEEIPVLARRALPRAHEFLLPMSLALLLWWLSR